MSHYKVVGQRGNANLEEHHTKAPGTHRRGIESENPQGMTTTLFDLDAFGISQEVHCKHGSAPLGE